MLKVNIYFQLIKQRKPAGKKSSLKRFLLYPAIQIIYIIVAATSIAQYPGAKIKPVNFSKVNITDNFWKPRIEKVSQVTIPVCIDQTAVKTARIRNFEKVARKN